MYWGKKAWCQTCVRINMIHFACCPKSAFDGRILCIIQKKGKSGEANGEVPMAKNGNVLTCEPKSDVQVLGVQTRTIVATVKL
jgi:hypothetical protein